LIYFLDDALVPTVAWAKLSQFASPRAIRSLVVGRSVWRALLRSRPARVCVI